MSARQSMCKASARQTSATSFNSTVAAALGVSAVVCFFFFSSRRRHTRFDCDWSSDVCSSDLMTVASQNLARQTLIFHLEGGALRRPKPGDEFDLWRDSKGPRLFGAHAFTGTDRKSVV